MKNVEIEISVTELKNVLPGLGKIIPRHTTLPVLGCVKLSLDEAGEWISLQANNLEEVATARLQNKTSGTPGEMLVPYEMLAKILKGCPAEQSVRFIGNKQETKIRYAVADNTVDRLLEHVPAGEFPATKALDREPIPLEDTFKAALKEALDCASEDSSRYVLNGACLDVRTKEAHYVVGTDGRHLYSANSFQFSLPETLIIPNRKFVTWPGFVSDGPWELRMLPAVRIDPEDKQADRNKQAPAWFQLESERWTYLAKAIDGQYPNWKQVVPTDTAKWTLIALSPEAVQMMQQALPLLPGADSLTQTIVLEAAENRFCLRARCRDDKGDTRMVVPEVRITGKPVEVALNRTYLSQALRFGFRELRIEDSLTPIVFTSAAKSMIIMPVRLEGPAAPAAQAPAAQEAPGNQQPSPPENASAVHPSTAPVANPTETQRNTMPENTGTLPRRGNPNGNGNGNGATKRNEEADSALSAVMEKIDRIKTSLRQVIPDLAEAQNLIKTAAKEKRAAEKEVESVRAALRSLQKVEI